MKLSVLVSTITAFTVASAAAVPKSDLFSVVRRQTTSTECAFYCDSLKNIADACGKDISCLCSPLAASVMYTCATCDLKVGSDTFSDLQSTLICCGVDRFSTFLAYSNDCAQSGYPIGALALSAC
ncbi:hypothetical protein M407DRAFT_9973 [Tulasnella calospora MUT 4182]|uniref:Extracellular membrane protein CFEM domain-containing protein n=1 Tax=Tulasnella calospora MUT 4182 TaxID=1051891 RepID=A0A0C3QBA9_9AGAM|nr:hypothetical protein M407DRAFT_9973 [Tulasnella calospora MUT 4182]